MEDALRIILPVYFAAFFGIAFVWRSWAVKKQTGFNPYVIGSEDNAYGYIGRIFRLTMALVLAVILVYSLYPYFYAYTGPFELFERDWIRIAGLIMLGASLILAAVAQAQMGKSWRIGIDTEHRTELVDSGLFGISRNPIFLALRVTQLGFLLTLPNVLMLVAVVMGEVSMQIQVRLEEEHLRRMHGEAYEAYSRKVRRWL